MKHIVFDEKYPCGSCEIISRNEKDKTVLVKISEISDQSTLQIYLNKEVSIGDQVTLNVFEIKIKITQEMFKNLLSYTDFATFDGNKIDTFEELYSLLLFKLTGQRADIRNQLSKREWVELVQASINV